jgi:S1-C subfamily serine protease
MTANTRANFSAVRAEVVAQDDQQDVVILKMMRNPFAGEVRSGIVINDKEEELLFGTTALGEARPDDGEPIALSGYPLSSPVLVTTSGAIATSWTWDVHEEESVGGVRFPMMADIYLADVQGNPGNSGGPAYRIVDGVVIGVCIQMQVSPTFDEFGEPGELAANAGLTVLRPISVVTRLAETL